MYSLIISWIFRKTEKQKIIYFFGNWILSSGLLSEQVTILESSQINAWMHAHYEKKITPVLYSLHDLKVSTN